MKKLALCIFFALFSFFSCDDIDTCTFAEDGGRMYVTVENTLDESVSAKVVIVEKQENTGEWSLAGNWCEKVIQAGESFTIETYVGVFDFRKKSCWSFIFEINGDLYLGFPKTEPCTDFDFGAKEILKDDIQKIILSGTSENPEFLGLQPQNITGMEEGKVYEFFAEHFSITIGDEVGITLDKVEF